MNIQFQGLTLYRSASQEKITQLIQADPESFGMSIQCGQRQLGPNHEIIQLSGKDNYALFESLYSVTIPEELKSQPLEESMQKIESEPQYAGLKGQLEAFDAASGPQHGFDFTPLLNITTKVFEYLGFCLGKGADAEGNPVKIVDLDQAPPSA